jgi:hypothetical protein
MQEGNEKNDGNNLLFVCLAQFSALFFVTIAEQERPLE